MVAGDEWTGQANVIKNDIFCQIPMLQSKQAHRNAEPLLGAMRWL
jgi:hypothetical protein